MKENLYNTAPVHRYIFKHDMANRIRLRKFIERLISRVVDFIVVPATVNKKENSNVTSKALEAVQNNTTIN